MGAFTHKWLFSLIVLNLGLFCSTTYAGSAPQRFTPYLQGLEKVIQPGKGSEQIAEELVEGINRVHAFNLQALGKIYGKLDEDFAVLRSDFKTLEDVIGEYDKYNDWLKSAKRQMQKEIKETGSASQHIEKKVAELSAAKDASLTKLEKFLSTPLEFKSSRGDRINTPTWLDAEGGRLGFWQSFLQNYPWPKPEDDQDYINSRLRKQLKKVYEAEWDFNFLEEGNGLHEFRREIRWFNMQAGVLNGAITFRDDDRDCPIAAYEPLLDGPLANSKYGRLPKNAKEPNPCKISKCLYLATTDIIGKVGNIKDDVEKELNVIGINDDQTPKKHKQQVEEIYQEMMNNQLLETLDRQIKSCQN